MKAEKSENLDHERYRIDGKLGEAVAGAGRVRCCARLAALITVVGCAIVGGAQGLIGALLGGLLVEINLSLLMRTMSRSANWRGRSMWPTLGRFYLVFGFTAVACVIIVRSQFGHPLAFLLGLLSFFFGVVLALLSFIIFKPKTDSGS